MLICVFVFVSPIKIISTSRLPRSQRILFNDSFFFFRNTQGFLEIEVVKLKLFEYRIF